MITANLRCAILLMAGQMLLARVPGIIAEQSQSDADHTAKINSLIGQLRWHSGMSLEHYQNITEGVSQNLLKELDADISENVPVGTTAAQVKDRLNTLLGYPEGSNMHNVAFSANLFGGRFLIVGIELQGAGTNQVNGYGDRVCFRAYKESSGKFVYVANIENLSDSALADLNALPLTDQLIKGEFWFMAWADVPPQSPYTITMRLYAFDGERFRTVWSPKDIIAPYIDSAIQVGPGDSVTINRLPVWDSQTVLHEQYVVTSKGPEKINEWTSDRH